MAELPSSAVAPPKRMRRGPMYPGVPSSPTAGTAVSVCPQRQPGPSSFFSITALTAVYPGAGLGPVAPAAAGAGATVGVPGVDGAEADDDDEVSLAKPPCAATEAEAAAVAAASESESDSVVMRESTSIAEPPTPPLLGFGGLEIRSCAAGVAPPYAARRPRPRILRRNPSLLPLLVVVGVLLVGGGGGENPAGADSSGGLGLGLGAIVAEGRGEGGSGGWWWSGGKAFGPGRFGNCVGIREAGRAVRAARGKGRQKRGEKKKGEEELAIPGGVGGPTRKSGYGDPNVGRRTAR